MRNELVYGITKDEVLTTLRRIKESYQADIESTGAIGDMTPAILDVAITMVQSHDALVVYHLGQPRRYTQKEIDEIEARGLDE